MAVVIEVVLSHCGTKTTARLGRSGKPQNEGENGGILNLHVPSRDRLLHCDFMDLREGGGFKLL